MNYANLCFDTGIGCNKKVEKDKNEFATDQSQLFAFHGSSERSCVLITLSDYRLGKIMGYIEKALLFSD